MQLDTPSTASSSKEESKEDIKKAAGASRYIIDDDFKPAPFKRDYRVDDLLDVVIVDPQDSTATNSTVMSGGVNFGNLSRIGAKVVCDSCQGYLEKKSPSIFIKWQVSPSEFMPFPLRPGIL